MIVIIIISGIITCGAIISTKYYDEDDISGIFYLVVRFTRWKLRKRHIAHYPVKFHAQKERIVIASDTRSPDSTGNTNTHGFKSANKIVGKIIITA
jgi:hypothetical protein